jgi:hypothetical protein
MTTLASTEQLILEMINRARMDPAAEAARIGIDLNAFIAPGTISATSKQVLAGSNALANIAESHDGFVQSSGTLLNGNPHDGAGDGTADSRIVNAGYVNWRGENIAWNPATTDEQGLATIIQDALFKDDPNWNHGTPGGHRLNILNDNFREVGVGAIRGTVGTNANSMIVTEDFGTVINSKTFLTGVVYNDTKVADDFYSLNEGVQGVTATVTNSAGTTLGSDSTGSGGGWGVGTAGGTLTVTFSGGGLAAAVSATVDAGTRNAKVDLVNGNEIFANVNTTLGAGAKELHLLGMDNINGTGNAAANTILGNKGANQITGGGGDDIIDGLAGSDTAVFSGSFAQYQVVSKVGNKVVIADTRSGADGTDSISNVEFFKFADKTVAFSDLQAVAAPVAGSVSIGDATIDEGNNGTQQLVFTLSRSGGTAAFNVDFSTANGTATTTDGDYVAKTGTVQFAANETSKTVSITINGDTKVEANETFSVGLSNATGGATVGDGTGVGTISNDDAAAVNHAPVATINNHSLWTDEWSKVGSWISYSDAENNPATQYQFWDSGTATDSGYFWTPANAHWAAATAITVAAADLGNVWVRGGHTGGSETMWVRAFDGTDWSDWDSFTLNTATAISSKTTTDATGASSTTYTDAKGEQAWSSQTHNFDSQGRETSATVTYDDGSVQGATFDATGNQSWTSQNSNTNAQGQLTNMGVIYDDGTQQTAIFDTTGQAWTSQNAVYDAQGRQTILGVIYDDGHTEVAFFDAANDQAWTSQSSVFDPQGHLVAMSVTYDNGHVDNWHI